MRNINAISTLLILTAIILITSSCAIPTNPAGDTGFITGNSLESATAGSLTQTVGSSVGGETESLTLEPPANNDDFVGGEHGTCKHSGAFHESYHAFIDEFIDYVGEEAFYAWVEKTKELSLKEASEDCKYKYTNISQFIKDFNIPKEDFLKLCDNTAGYYTHDYNVDILYSGDDKLIDEYYSNTPADILSEHRKRMSEYILKSLISGIIGNEKLTSWEKDKGYTPINWSIPQVVKEFNITRDDFQSALDKLKDEETYDYDVDKLYSGDAEISAALRDGVPAVEIDAMLHK